MPEVQGIPASLLPTFTISFAEFFMSQGEVLQIDTPSELYETPRTRDVASFISTLHCLEGRVTGQVNSHAAVAVDGLGMVTAGSRQVPDEAGAPLSFAIRPEKLKVHFEKPADGFRARPATVEEAACLDERSQVQDRRDGMEAPLAVSAQDARVQRPGPSLEGRTVWPC